MRSSKPLLRLLRAVVVSRLRDLNASKNSFIACQITGVENFSCWHRSSGMGSVAQALNRKAILSGREHSTSMVGNQSASQQDVERILGDSNLLVEQLGSPGDMTSLPPGLGSPAFPQVTDLASLRNFLFSYHTRVLVPIELPAIRKAFDHAARSEARELIQLDQQMGLEPLLKCFGAASRQVGKAHLRQLRPLRDQRVLQRYIAAVQSGAAQGWHTVVYGLVLSLYSLPLRQGLISYAHQATSGWVNSCSGRLGLSEVECCDLILETCSPLRGAVDEIVAELRGLAHSDPGSDLQPRLPRG